MTSGDAAGPRQGALPPSAQNQAPWSVGARRCPPGGPRMSGRAVPGALSTRLGSPWSGPRPGAGRTGTLALLARPGALARAPARVHWHGAPWHGAHCVPL